MKKFIAFFFTVATMILSVVAAKELSSHKVKKVDGLNTVSPVVRTIKKVAVATGRILPRKEVEIKSQVSGVVESLFVKRGQTVKKGDPIAKIQLVPDAEHLNSALASVERAQKRYRQSKKELEKYQALFKNNMVSETELSALVLENNLNFEELQSEENRVNLIKGNKSNNEVSLSNIVVATIDGTVLDLPVKQGFYITRTNSFNDGTTLAYVADMQDLIFEGLVDEFEVGSLRSGMDINVRVAVFGEEVFGAKLENVSLRGKWDQGVIKYSVEAKIIQDKDYLFRSGYSANAEIIISQREDVLAVNEGDIYFDDGESYVDLVVKEDHIIKSKIETGLSDGINVEVIAGLDANSYIRDL